MPRSVIIIVAFTTLSLLSSAVADPVPATTPEKPFHPTDVGTRWVYQVGKTVTTLEIGTSEDKEGAIIIAIESVGAGGKKYPREKMEVSPKGLFRLEIGSAKFDRPLCLLKRPAVAEDQWEFHISGPEHLRVESGLARTYGTEEAVEVPAGKYKAVRVDMRTTAIRGEPRGDDGPVTTFYFAPGVGLVKMVSPGTEMVLKSFSPGKPRP